MIFLHPQDHSPQRSKWKPIGPALDVPTEPPKQIFPPASVPNDENRLQSLLPGSSPREPKQKQSEPPPLRQSPAHLHPSNLFSKQKFGSEEELCEERSEREKFAEPLPPVFSVLSGKENAVSPARRVEVASAIVSPPGVIREQQGPAVAGGKRVQRSVSKEILQHRLEIKERKNTLAPSRVAIVNPGVNTNLPKRGRPPASQNASTPTPQVPVSSSNVTSPAWRSEKPSNVSPWKSQPAQKDLVGTVYEFDDDEEFGSGSKNVPVTTNKVPPLKIDSKLVLMEDPKKKNRTKSGKSSRKGTNVRNSRRNDSFDLVAPPTPPASSSSTSPDVVAELEEEEDDVRRSRRRSGLDSEESEENELVPAILVSSSDSMKIKLKIQRKPGSKGLTSTTIGSSPVLVIRNQDKEEKRKKSPRRKQPASSSISPAHQEPKESGEKSRDTVSDVIADVAANFSSCPESFTSNSVVTTQAGAAAFQPPKYDAMEAERAFQVLFEREQQQLQMQRREQEINVRKTPVSEPKASPRFSTSAPSSTPPLVVAARYVPCSFSTCEKIPWTMDVKEVNFLTC
jgi:hypothetical protein